VQDAVTKKVLKASAGSVLRRKAHMRLRCDMDVARWRWADLNMGMANEWHAAELSRVTSDSDAKATAKVVGRRPACSHSVTRRVGSGTMGSGNLDVLDLELNVGDAGIVPPVRRYCRADAARSGKRESNDNRDFAPGSCSVDLPGGLIRAIFMTRSVADSRKTGFLKVSET
jgi:hypothetical protein